MYLTIQQPDMMLKACINHKNKCCFLRKQSNLSLGETQPTMCTHTQSHCFVDL